MALRKHSLPSHRERVALQKLQIKEWADVKALHPTGAITLEKMLGKGWIEKDGVNGLFRITVAGRAAFVVKIPLKR